MTAGQEEPNLPPAIPGEPSSAPAQGDSESPAEVPDTQKEAPEESAASGTDSAGSNDDRMADSMARRYQDSLDPEKRYSLTDRARAVMEFFERQARGEAVSREDCPEAFQGPDWDYGRSPGTSAKPSPESSPVAPGEISGEIKGDSGEDKPDEKPETEAGNAEIPAAPAAPEPHVSDLRESPAEPALDKTGGQAVPGEGSPLPEPPETVTLDKTEDNLGNCPECGAPLSLYRTRRGQMAGCSRYPACRYMKPVAGIYKVRIEEIIPDSACPECGSPMAVKSGRYGQFVGCTNYPECGYIFREKPERLPCPECGQGNLTLRKTRFQKLFWSCDRYPACTCRLNRKPVRERCQHCQSPVMLEFRGRQGVYLKCPLCGKRQVRGDK
ncbi:topoisomerase DNA-binding C4 zinc finger domain-containing protein [Succinimonas sp.]|uniref:DNA topoisomerase family protein n=1 Tax=Succinimonas sp. TaxID=1936151 RepID=UPI00386C11DD